MTKRSIDLYQIQFGNLKKNQVYLKDPKDNLILKTKGLCILRRFYEFLMPRCRKIVDTKIFFGQITLSLINLGQISSC